jgi:hypothetical protein
MPNAAISANAMCRIFIFWFPHHCCLVAAASPTHFVMKLVFAAPLSFFSTAVLSQAAFASFSHLPMKLFFAVPASFFSVACSAHVAAKAGSAEMQRTTLSKIALVKPARILKRASA